MASRGLPSERPFLGFSQLRFFEYLGYMTTLFTILFLVGAATAESGTTPGSPPSLGELTRVADVIVIGEVVLTQSEWNASRTIIWTRIDVGIEEVLKGSVQGEQLSFSQIGGQVGDIAASIGGTPSFRQGEHVLLFLSRRQDKSLGIAGIFYGKFAIERSEASDNKLVVRREPDSGRVLDRYSLDQARAQILQTMEN